MLPLAAGAVVAALGAPTLLYPIDHRPQVTSVVGTYRIGHHHAGLDLTTDDRLDARVLAALDGEVIRIKRGHFGYGRSVYVRHADGLTTVYGHMERFSPALEAVARVAEKAAGAYGFEKNLDPPLPVKRGDTLGIVGTSGTDLVHLHFELRRDNLPIDPLQNGLTIPDTQAPRPTRVLFQPRDASARVEGLLAPLERAVASAGPEPPVSLSGRVGLAVEWADRIDGSARDLEPASLELRIDGVVAHRVRYDRASYAEKNLTEIDYLAERRADASGRFHRMYRDPVDAPAMVAWPGPTVNDLGHLTPGPHRLEVEARDAAGHRGLWEQVVHVVPAADPCPTQSGTLMPRAADAPRLQGTRWFESTLVIPVPEACRPGFRWGATLDGRPLTRPHRFTATETGPALAIDLDPDRDVRLSLAVSADGVPERTGSFEAYSIRPGAEIRVPALGAAFDVGATAVFAPYLVDVSPAPNPGTPALEPVGPLVVFRPTWRPARGPSRVRLTVPEAVDTDGLALFFQEGKRFWRVGGRRTGSPPALEGSLVHPGPVGLMRDATPPVIGDLRRAAHPAGARLEIPVSDPGAGVDIGTLRVRLDGRPIHPEYFHAYGLLTWRPVESLGAGRHAVEVRVQDAAGHESRRTQRFRLEARWAPE